MDASVVEQFKEEEMIPPMEPVLVETKPVLVEEEPLVKPVKKTRRKRCSRGRRRNTKTHRCNKKCPEGSVRSKTSRRCLKNKK